MKIYIKTVDIYLNACYNEIRYLLKLKISILSCFYKINLSNI